MVLAVGLFLGSVNCCFLWLSLFGLFCQASIMSSLFLAAFSTSVAAVTKIVMICAAGAYLQRAGILNKDIRQAISQMSLNLFLPCLLFTNILPTISLEKLPTLGWLAAANLIYVGFGLLIGYLSVLVTRPSSPSMRSILTATPAIGHANAIPFVLVGLIVSQEPVFKEDDVTTAQGYVGLYLIMHNITLWGVGMNIIKEKDEGPASSASPQSDCTSQTQTTAGALHPTSIGRVISGLTLSDSLESEQQTRQLKPWDKVAECRQRIPEWLNRPVGTAMFTTVLALIPGVKDVFVSGLLSPVFGAMSALGHAGPSVALLVVGALFVADGVPHPSTIGYAPLCAFITARLVFLPACCIGLWAVLRRHLSIYPSDPALTLVMCLECCTPTAYLLVT